MSDKIRDYRDYQRKSLSVFASHMHQLSGAVSHISSGFAEAPVVKAEINHGRWIAKCPFCNGAELVDPQDLRFMCCSCFNSKVGGKWLKIEMPDAETKEAVEKALLARPERSTRSWLHGESAKDLEAENDAMGVIADGMER